MDTQHRLTLRDLSCHPWLKPQSAPSTPLHITPLHKGTASALKHTFHAFYQATKAGFTLGDVSRARLAKRRKDKRGAHSRLEQVVPSQSSADGSVVRPSQLGLNALRTWSILCPFNYFNYFNYFFAHYFYAWTLKHFVYNNYAFTNCGCGKDR